MNALSSSLDVEFCFQNNMVLLLAFKKRITKLIFHEAYSAIIEEFQIAAIRLAYHYHGPAISYLHYLRACPDVHLEVKGTHG